MRRLWFWFHGWHKPESCDWCAVKALYVAEAHERGKMPATKQAAWLLAFLVGFVVMASFVQKQLGF